MVASSRAPDLDVAIVKATSHDDIPANEKYIQEILYLTSCYRGYVSACVAGLAKRLSRTHDWIVAIKTLMVTHRLLKDGDPSFEDELMFVSRRMLNVSNFRDDSHSNAWDYSAFVRTYGMYLNERLDCFASFSGQSNRNNSREDYRSSYDDRRSGYDNYRSDYGSSYNDDRRRDSPEKKQNQNILVKDMMPDMLLEKLPSLQRLLERVLACRPTGAAKHHRLVQMSLYSILGESFQIYSELCDGITILLDGFFDMEHQDCVKAFDIYSRSAKQAEDLSSFYNVTKSVGICRPSEYPTMQKISKDQLDSLEDYLRDRSRSSLRSLSSKSPEPVPVPIAVEPEPQLDGEASQNFTTIKALPAPAVEQTDVSYEEKHKPDADLITLDGASMSAEEQENKLALALFTSTSTTENGNWETFRSNTEQGATFEQSKAMSPSWHNASENGKAGWELALVTEASNLSKAGGLMAGGFNRLLLDSMYDQATVSQNYSSTVPVGSASSVALPGKPPSSILALPAPAPVLAAEDPFAASVGVPPPSYVQMADVRQKQQLLIQEQQIWQQYQRDGMQGTYGIMKLQNGYPAFVPQNSLSLPYYGMHGFAQSGYAHY
ncbi:hypothetical protein O6H91_10G026700 [Diphasiastrum complanatum]|nr:hypothetical protein O6H91_10G026600 [Diphasiastrum complanatum]KAJ7540691.1 hypothetical protein O6H91_10G026700 [Diphasiastrum complanatum]